MTTHVWDESTTAVDDFATTQEDSSSSATGSAVFTPIAEDDVRLTSEPLEASASELDPYAAPPPPPDAKYRVKLKQIDVTYNGQKVKYAPKTDGSSAWFATALELTIQDPSGQYDGIRVYDYQVSTKPRKNGNSTIMWILQCLKVKLPTKFASHKELMDFFQKNMATEPDLVAELTWEGQLSQDDSKYYKDVTGEAFSPSILGMTKFPPDGHGGRLAKITREVKGKKGTVVGEMTFTARSRATGYFPLGSK